MATSNKKRILQVAVILVIFWNIAAWFIAQGFIQSRIEELIDQETSLAQDRAHDLADSIQRNLAYVSGIPVLFSQGPRFRNAPSRSGSGNRPSSLPAAARVRAWSLVPQLGELDRFLASMHETLHVGLAYVLDAAGDCVADSNADTPGNPVGLNFAERDNFRMIRPGQPDIQYAEGKTTHIAGPYFSRPAIVNDRFMGSPIAKMDAPSLSFLIHSTPAFVTDENGVIIRAQGRALELSALAGSAIGRMTGEFDIDCLKIEQSFVRKLGGNANDSAACEAIIVMAHKLDLKVIAEGVEAEQQRDEPADEFEQLLSMTT
ncbi:MAG TPA: EAL domain-containing protein [Gallionellaceae bacterium]|nr:EAL domain-containing protein [Gallionellaceae bacterium]